MRERGRQTPPPMLRERANLISSEPRLAVWVCPSPVALTESDIAAAFYAYAEIDDTRPYSGRDAIIVELEFIVARIGTRAIEKAADRISAHDTQAMQACAEDTCVDDPSASRLAWCQQIARMVMARLDSAGDLAASEAVVSKDTGR